MEVSTDIFQRIPQISFWLVYIVPQILIAKRAVSTRLVPPARPPRSQPPVPPPRPPEPPRPLRFEKFNGDIILEVFRYYVSSQPDGAFILTLVSTSWRDFVLQSPVLWQWITIDEQSPDWIEKAYLSVTLCGACPLQIVLRLPIKECDRLVPLLSRCQNLFFEIPDYMTGRDVDQGTEKLLSAFKTPHNCTFHYLRAGEYLLQEAREQISIDLSNVQRLNFVADGSEHPNYHEYAKTRRVRYLEYGDDYRPLVLLKLYSLLEVLRNASNLRTLTVSHHSMDPIFSDFDLPVVTLVNLEELRITGIDYNRNGSLVPLSQSIQCPNLLTLVLCGAYVDIMNVVEHLGRIVHPLNLELRCDRHTQREPVVPTSFHLPSVTCLRLQVNQGSLGSIATEVCVNAAIHIAHHATVLRLIIEGQPPHLLDKNTVVECLRHYRSSEEKCNMICRHYATLELAGMALVEIDIKAFTPFHASGRVPRIAARISSQVLTTLACTPFVLLPILSQHPLPMLNTIQLHVPESHRNDVLVELLHFDKVITHWIIRHVKGSLPLKVHTFALSWFPNWRTLLPMLYCMSKNLCDGQGLVIKLPAFPHLVIHQALVLALEGKDDGASSVPSVPLNGKASSGMKALIRGEDEPLAVSSKLFECYYCKTSGLQCNPDSTRRGFISYCDRYSITDLVSLTRHTVVNVGDEE